MTIDDFKVLMDLIHRIDVISVVVTVAIIIILFIVYWSEEHHREK